VKAKPDKTHSWGSGAKSTQSVQNVRPVRRAIGGFMELGQQLRVDTASVDEATDKVRRSIPELEIAGPGDIRNLSR